MKILITGASSGFGAELSRILVKQNHQVLGVARRQEKLQQLAIELGEKFTPICADITQSSQLNATLEPLIYNVDVLVNNAGLALGLEPAQNANLNDWHTMINTNISALVNLTHFVLPYMVKRQFGTIINVGSTAGNYAYFGGNVYGATKAFVSQFSDNLRTDLAGQNIRVCNIEPGLCEQTEFSHVRFKGDQTRVKQTYANAYALTAQDIANTISWIIGLPQHMNVNHLEIMPTTQNSAGLQVTKKHIN